MISSLYYLVTAGCRYCPSPPHFYLGRVREWIESQAIHDRCRLSAVAPERIVYTGSNENFKRIQITIDQHQG